MEGCEQRRDRPDLGPQASPPLLMAASGRMDCERMDESGSRETRVEGTHWPRWVMTERDQGESHGESQK